MVSIACGRNRTPIPFTERAFRACLRIGRSTLSPEWNVCSTPRVQPVEEIDRDVAGRGVYLSSYLTDDGKAKWPSYLREAADTGTDDSLAHRLNAERCFRDKVERRKPKGGFTMAAVPHTAAQTLAESQFNMYFMRALARRALDEGRALVVYRAKEVANPRPESERMIGTTLDAAEVLQVLRDTLGVEPAINIPLPNTGVTVSLA